MGKKAWKRMSSGRYIDLNNMTIDDVDIGDINTSLNNLLRFNGHYKDTKPLTVAQHTQLCVNLSSMLFPGDERVRVGCIIHDFGEAYYGDIATPVKAILGPKFRQFINPIDKLIELKFWPFPDEEGPSKEVHEAVKVCDLLSLDIERRVMWKSQRGKDKWPEAPDFKLSLFDKQAMFEEVSGKQVDLKGMLNVLDT